MTKQDNSSKRPLPSVGVALYPPPRMIGNAAQLERIKTHVFGKNPESLSVTLIIAPWGMGKTHAGYRIHHECARKDLKDEERQIVSRHFASKAICFFVPLSFLQRLNLDLTFTDIQKAALYTLHPHPQRLEGICRDFVGISDRLMERRNDMLRSVDGLRDFLENYFNPAGQLETEETPDAILRNMAVNFDIEDIVIVVDEMEEIEREGYTPRQRTDFVRSTKTIISESKGLGEQVRIHWVLLLAGKEWDVFKREIPSEREAFGPYGRRIWPTVLERPDPSSWMTLLDQYEVPTLVEHLRSKRANVLSALWMVSGHNFGWFLRLVYLLSQHKDDIVENKDHEIVARLIRELPQSYGVFFISNEYERLVSNLNDIEKSIFDCLMWSSQPLSADELAIAAGCDKSVEDIIKTLNQKTAGQNHPTISSLCKIKLRSRVDSGERLIREPKFFEESGPPVVKSAAILKTLVSDEKKDFFWLWDSWNDFYASLRWFLYDQAGVLVVMKPPVERMHRALIKFQVQPAVKKYAISPWTRAKLIRAFEVEKPLKWLEDEKEQRILERLELRRVRNRAILRGLLYMIMRSSCEFESEPSKKLRIENRRGINFVGDRLHLLLPSKKSIGVPMKIYFLHDTAGMERLSADTSSLNIIFTRQSVSSEDVPQQCLSLSLPDPDFLAFHGFHSSLAKHFPELEQQRECCWDENDCIDEARERYDHVLSEIVEEMNLEDVIFNSIGQLKKQGLCVSPLITPGVRHISARSPLPYVSFVFMKRVNDQLRDGNLKAFLEDELRSWTRSYIDYSADVENQEILPKIFSESQKVPTGFYIPLSSTNVLNYLMRLRTTAYSTRIDVDKIKRRLEGRTIIVKFQGQTTDAVIEQHLRFLAAVGHIMISKDEEVSLIKGNEEAFAELIKDKIKSVIAMQEEKQDQPFLRQVLLALRLWHNPYLNEVLRTVGRETVLDSELSLASLSRIALLLDIPERGIGSSPYETGKLLVDFSRKEKASRFRFEKRSHDPSSLSMFGEKLNTTNADKGWTAVFAKLFALCLRRDDDGTIELVSLPTLVEEAMDLAQSCNEKLEMMKGKEAAAHKRVGEIEAVLKLGHELEAVRAQLQRGLTDVCNAALGYLESHDGPNFSSSVSAFDTNYNNFTRQLDSIEQWLGALGHLVKGGS